MTANMEDIQENLFKESLIVYFSLNFSHLHSDKVLLHPSDTVNIKLSILKELNKKLMKWDDGLKGIFLSYDKVQILNGGKGRIMDDYAWLQYVVRYKVTFAQPKVEQKLCKLLQFHLMHNLSVAV